MKCPGGWYAKECFRLARETYTPIEFYAGLTVREFFYWRKNVIDAMKEDEKNRPKMQKTRRK